MTDRLKACFDALRAEDKAGFVTFLAAGDPDFETSLSIIEKLPAAGVDVIEIGMPFSDPMADGPSVQAASLRALQSGMNLSRTLELAAKVRDTNPTTPIVLMGYFNPIHHYGVDRFLSDAVQAGIDGLIVVDLPPEEDGELCLPAIEKGLSFIRLATPTTHNARLATVLENASGFVYYVSITGVTGAAAPVADRVAAEVTRLRGQTDLPIAVGFGIREPAQAAEIAKKADAAVVGSAIVDIIADHVSKDQPVDDQELQDQILTKVEALAEAIHGARL